MPYSDSSLIVKGFCFDFGVQSFLVKSAKSHKNPFKSSLDPLAESEIVFHDSGKSDLHFIREAALIDWFPNLRKDLEKTAMAEVMAEITAASRIPFTAIVNNSNLGRETTARDVEETIPICNNLSELSGLPVVFTSVDSGLRLDVKADNLFPMQLQQKLF